jgi:hypothetical protein
VGLPEKKGEKDKEAGGREMMRVVVLILTLSVTIPLSAATRISVNGVVDDEVFLLPSETASIGIWGDGTSGQGNFYLGITENSPASLDVTRIIVSYPPEDPIWPDIIWDPIIPGLKLPIIGFYFFDMTPPEAPLLGQLADDVILHADDWGSTTVQLYTWYGDNFMLLDNQVILQIPEPTTIALLGLGVLILKRRR